MPKKLVVIDDDEDVVNMLKTLFKSKGYITHVAYNGEEGLRRIEETKPDIVIVDLMMPQKSGLEVIRELRREPKTKDLPIMVISGITKNSDKPEEFWKLGLGADDFISKPFDPLALLGRVEYILRRKDYVSEQAGQVRGNNMQKLISRPQTDLEKATPRQVVKAFIEAWNDQDFATEYNCLGEEMRGPIKLRDYVGRRRQRYRDEEGQRKKQKCEEILEATQSRNAARVVCLRTDVKDERITQKKQEAYVLRKSPNGWKIIAVRSKPA